jgi:hypothetical protein
MLRPQALVLSHDASREGHDIGRDRSRVRNLGVGKDLGVAVQKLVPRVSNHLRRKRGPLMGVIWTIAVVVLVVAVALWFLRRA